MAFDDSCVKGFYRIHIALNLCKNREIADDGNNDCLLFVLWSAAFALPGGISKHRNQAR